MSREATKTRRGGWGKPLKIAAFNLLLALAMLEILGLAAYAYRTRTLYYTNPPVGRAMPETIEGLVESYRIHPYLGFIIRPSASVAEDDGEHHYNDVGFDSPHEYPHPRSDRQLIVAITGGSAASHLAVFENRQRVLAARLAADLGLEGPERVTVLNFAQGGFKQPQQLLIYQYLRALGQEIDLLVSFDGFNEIALGAGNRLAGVAVDMPSVEHVRALQEVTSRTTDTAGLEAMVDARRAWHSYSKRFNRAWSGEAWETRFAGGFFVDYVIYRLAARRYEKLRFQFVDPGPTDSGNGLSWLYLNPIRGQAPIDDLDVALDHALDLWSHGARQLWRAAEADGAAYVHIVQPNQYHPTARTYDEAERQVAFNPRSPYRDRIEAGYPQLVEAVAELRDEGLPIDAPLEMLDAIPEAVYIDDCCHFTDVAQQHLLEHIAELAVAELRALERFTPTNPGALPTETVDPTPVTGPEE